MPDLTVPVESISFGILLRGIAMVQEAAGSIAMLGGSLVTSKGHHRRRVSTTRVLDALAEIACSLREVDETLTTAAIEYVGGQTQDAQNLVREARKGGQIVFSYDKRKQTVQMSLIPGRAAVERGGQPKRDET
jgi:hypothetical protein